MKRMILVDMQKFQLLETTMSKHKSREMYYIKKKGIFWKVMFAPPIGIFPIEIGSFFFKHRAKYVVDQIITTFDYAYLLGKIERENDDGENDE